MKNLIFISSFLLIGLAAAGQKSVKKDPKTDGRYKSLKEALAEPEKVKSLSADRKDGIPDSISKFPNLESFSVFLEKGDLLPADLGKAGKLNSLVIFSETVLTWTDLLCSLPPINNISIAGPMTVQTEDSLKKCIQSGNLKIYKFAQNKKQLRQQKEKEKVKCGSVEAALKSEMKNKELYLRDRDDLQDINRIHEVKDLTKLVIWSFSNREMDLSALSGSSTVTEAMIISGGKITGLDLSRFPNMESLTLYFDYWQQAKTIPFGLEKLKNLKNLDMGNVYFDKAEIEKLKSVFPGTSIILNHVPVQ